MQPNQQIQLQIEVLEARELLTGELPSLFDPALTSRFAHVAHLLVDGRTGPDSASYNPAQIRRAYGFDRLSLDGSGQTIAIVDAYDHPNMAGNLATFDQSFGLPAPPSFRKVDQNGGTNYPRADANWALEIALDVEWAHAIAPAANLLLVEANSNNDGDLLTAVNYARFQSGVVAVSMSWGGSEFSGENSYDGYFSTPAGHLGGSGRPGGVTFVASSGDYGARNGPEWPSISSHVLSVGGTSLTLDSQGNYGQETGWSYSSADSIYASGGGYSQYLAEPSYQLGVQSTGRRSNPDVAYDGDPDTGFRVYTTLGANGWVTIGGTSASAPQWAALLALTSQLRGMAGLGSFDGFSQTLPWIYTLPSNDFHDIVSGYNGYDAGPGYDLVTGIGTPYADRIAHDIGILPATHFSVTGPVEVTAGQTFSLTVRALDDDNYTDTAFTGTIHLTSSDGAAILPSDSTFTSTDQGVKTFSVVLRTARTQPPQTVTATDSRSGITGSASVRVVPDVASALVLSDIPPILTADVPNDVTVTARDRFGNTATGYRGTVHFASMDSAATLPADHTFTADDAGRYTWANGLTLRTPGTWIVSVTDTVNLGTKDSIAITILPAVAAALAINVQALFRAGESSDITVTALDHSGRTVPAYRGTVHLTSTDPAATLPANYTFTAADAGVHTFRNGVTLRTAGPQTITVTDTSNSRLTAPPARVEVFPGEASTFLFRDISNPWIAGVASDLTLVAADAYGNADPSYRGTVRFSSSDLSALVPPVYSFHDFDRGFHFWYRGLTLFMAGHPTLTATDLGPGGISGTVSLTVLPAPPVTLAISGLPPRVTAGAPFSLAVTPRDLFGNAVTTYRNVVHFTSTDGAALLPDDYRFTAADNGTRTFNGLLFLTAGSQTATVTDLAAGLTGSATVQVDPAAASTLVVADFPALTTAGTSGTFSVTAIDRFGNTATAYPGTIHFSSTDGQADLPADYTFTAADNGSHLFRAVLKTAGSQALTAADVADSTLTGTQDGLVVIPDVPAALAVDAPAAVSTGTPFAVTVSVYDQYGNLATGYLGTVTFTSSDGGALLPDDYSFTPDDGGVHTFTDVTLFAAGDQYLLVSDPDSGFSASAAITVGTGPGEAAPSRKRPEILPSTQPVPSGDNVLRSVGTGWLENGLALPDRRVLPTSAAHTAAAERVRQPPDEIALDRFFAGHTEMGRTTVLTRPSAAAVDDPWRDWALLGRY